MNEKNKLTITRNIGLNRGKSRIWIEGKSLSDYGWIKGASYAKDNSAKGLIVLTKDVKGKLNVAGGPDRPVLDLCGKYVSIGFVGFQKVSVEITVEKITIKGN